MSAEEELISWEEAEWTRQALGMSTAHFARLIGVQQAAVYRGQKYSQAYLKPQNALMLRLGVNRLIARS